jgi:microcystin degradation protein MlrC
MRIGYGYLVQESNSFSPVSTRLDDFGLLTGRTALERWRGTESEIAGVAGTLEAQPDVEAVPLFAGCAITNGPILPDDFAAMRTRVSEAVASAGRFDGLVISLHGAMCAQGTDDCEGALVETIRAVVGNEIPLVLTLDLHANMTAAIARLADAVIGYKTYPHIDVYQTGEAGARILLEALRTGKRPVTEMRKIPMILPAENMQTSGGPMEEVFLEGEAFRAASNSVFSVSVFGVQPWLDVAEMGCSTVAVSWGDRAAARECSCRMARRFWELRAQFEVELLQPREAIRRALALPGGPVVLAESSDSPTAGAPGDSADMLAALFEGAPQAPAALWLRDPAAVLRAWNAGEGATITLALGGGFDRVNRRPVAASCRVVALRLGSFAPKGKTDTGVPQNMGRTAVLAAGRVTVIVSEEAASNIDPELFRAFGVEPGEKKIVVVKSAAGFRSEYEPMAQGIFLVDTPGVSSANIRHLPYGRVPRPIYPLDDAATFAPLL